MKTSRDASQNHWPVRPMEPVTGDAAFDSADTLFQVKWDGVRILAYIYPDTSIRLFNRRLAERTAQYPDITRALEGLCGGTVLDGEAIAPGADGKPDFPRVLQRDLALSPGRIGLAAARIPVSYMVFDVLWLCGEAVWPRPLAERQKLLSRLPFRPGRVHRVESVPGAGKALFDAVLAEGLEGVVAKKSGSPYRIGQKTEEWRKIKCLRHANALIGGYLAEGARVRSLLVGVPREEGLWYIGAAASGVTQSQWRALGALFAKSAGVCPFLNPPKTDGARWVEPLMGVRVRFLEYTAGGLMRNPAVIGFSEEL